MTAFDVATWERCKELADMFGVKIEVRTTFKLRDKKGFMLGVLGTVTEVYAFLCVYEHSTHKTH